MKKFLAKNRKLVYVWGVIFFAFSAAICLASIDGDLLNRGYFLDEGNFTILNGSLTASNDVTATDDVIAGDDLVVSGLATVGETLAVTGAITGKMAIVDYVTTSAARTLTAAESGTVFMVTESGDDPVTFNLPTAAAGLTYTFIDLDATAAADLKIKAATGDTINGGTAAKIYECTGDAVKQSVTLVAVNATKWEVIAEIGTWANNNS